MSVSLMGHVADIPQILPENFSDSSHHIPTFFSQHFGGLAHHIVAFFQLEIGELPLFEAWLAI